jgi:hypothetical protein
MTAVPAALGLTSDQVLRIGRGWPVLATLRRAVGNVLLPAVPARV